MGDVDADDSSLPWFTFNIEVEVGTVEDAEAFADVAEADTFDVDVGHFFFGDADSVVFDLDVQAAIVIGGAQLDFAAVEFGS